MIRRLSNVASAISLLLCVATASLWMRSNRAADLWEAQRYRSYDVSSCRGTVTVEIESRYEFEETLGLVAGMNRVRRESPVAFSSRWQIMHVSVDPASCWGDGSFGFAVGQPGPSTGVGDLGDFVGTESKQSYLRFPCWLAAIVFALTPMLWIWPRARLRRGYCLSAATTFAPARIAVPNAARQSRRRRRQSMTRRLMNLAAAVSLAVCFTVTAGWAVSYVRPGHFIVDGAALHNDSVEIGSEWAWRVSSADGVLDVQPVYSYYQWTIGYWKLALASLVLPGRSMQLRLRRRRQRLLAGRCLSCGYDLRASANRCPECGTPIPSNANASA